MASTNKTTNFNLPQWVSSDKPTFEGDLNSAFLIIDNTMQSNKTTAESGNANANSALEKIGNLTLLETTVKDNLVNAINEIVSGGTTPSEIGDLSDLTTNAKNNIVSAINEVDALAKEQQSDNTNIWSQITSLQEQITPLVNNINNLTETVGNLSSLTTTAKDTIVDAINEVNGNKAPLIDKNNGNITTITNSNLSFSNGSSNVSGITATGTLKYSNTSNAFMIMGELLLTGTNVDQVAEIDLKINSNIKPPKVFAGISETIVGFVRSTDSSQGLISYGSASIYYDTSTSSLKVLLSLTGNTNNVANVYVDFMPITITDLQ